VTTKKRLSNGSFIAKNNLKKLLLGKRDTYTINIQLKVCGLNQIDLS